MVINVIHLDSKSRELKPVPIKFKLQAIFTLLFKNKILFYTQEGLQSSASLNKYTTYHKKWIWFQFTKV